VELVLMMAQRNAAYDGVLWWSSKLITEKGCIIQRDCGIGMEMEAKI
jgi:hypothetical protein